MLVQILESLSKVSSPFRLPQKERERERHLLTFTNSLTHSLYTFTQSKLKDTTYPFLGKQFAER